MRAIYASEDIEFSFFKPAEDDFEDNFYGDLVQVIAVSAEEELGIFVFGTGDFCLELLPADEDAYEQAIFDIIAMSEVSYISLLDLGFNEIDDQE